MDNSVFNIPARNKYLGRIVPSITKYLWVQLKPYRLPVLVGIASVFASTALDQISPILLSNILDGLRAHAPVQQIHQWLFVILGSAVISAILLWTQRWTVIRASRAIEYDMRSRLFEKLQRMPPAFFDARSTGDLMNLVTSDLDRVRDVVGPAILHLFRTGVAVIWSVSTLFYLSSELAMWALLPLALTPILANRGMAAMHRSFARIQKSLSELNTFAHDTLTGIGVVKGLGREAVFEERFVARSEDLRKLAIRSSWAQGILWPAITALGGIGICLLLWRGSLAASQNLVSVGTVAACVMVFFRLQWPMVGLGWVTSLFQRGIASLERLDALEREMDGFERSAHEGLTDSVIPPARAGVPLLDVRNLSFRHRPEGPAALVDISFTLQEGEGIGLAGGPGSGKTTLLALLSGLRRPPAGTVFLRGIDASSLQPEHVLKLFALVPQDGFLFSQTIMENIRMGQLADAPELPVETWSVPAAFDQDVPQIPGGYSAVLGERGINLSGGQRQRLSLARALAKDAEILLLDDTLSAVDATTEARILDHLTPMLAGRARIVTSHRYSAFRMVDRILVLQKGSITERRCSG
ncbi:MAG: hypothetical protein RL318_2374, partial [Fibrobacterota bacterium]